MITDGAHEAVLNRNLFRLWFRGIEDLSSMDLGERRQHMKPFARCPRNFPHFDASHR